MGGKSQARRVFLRLSEDMAHESLPAGFSQYAILLAKSVILTISDGSKDHGERISENCALHCQL